MNAAEQHNALRIMEVDVWRLRDDGRVLYGGAVGAVDEVDDDGVDTVDEQVVVGEVAGDGVSGDTSASVDASDKVDAGKVADDGASDQVVTDKVASDGESVDASDQVAVGKVVGDSVSGGANASDDASDQVAVGKVVGDSVSGGANASVDASDQVAAGKVAGDGESVDASASDDASDQVAVGKVAGDGVSGDTSASVDASDQVAVGKVVGDGESVEASASVDASDQVAVGKVASNGESVDANASVDASDQVAVGKVASNGESVDANASVDTSDQVAVGKVVDDSESAGASASDDASDDASIATEPPVDETLDIIRQQVAQCTQCVLHQSRKQTVFGVGDARADWLFVGEAPGREEDLQGEPFVGRAGKLLDLMLAALGMSREAVFIANVLKCRPPENRDPTAEEVALCENYLHRQLAIIQPKIIVALGRISAQALLKTDQPLAKLRGATHAYGRADTPLVVTYHPAYLLRSPGQKQKAWEDLWRAKMIVDES